MSEPSPLPAASAPEASTKPSRDEQRQQIKHKAMVVDRHAGAILISPKKSKPGIPSGINATLINLIKECKKDTPTIRSLTACNAVLKGKAARKIHSAKDSLLGYLIIQLDELIAMLRPTKVHTK